jgi:hypothetical protein
MFTIVDVVVEANPASFNLLRERVLALARKEDPKIKGAPSFGRLQRIPQLHFMSLQIFQDPHFDPLLIVETNFDGDSNTYWTSVLSEIGEDLRAIFACTKAALDPPWANLFSSESNASLAQFINHYSVIPSASHIGAVGLPLSRIKRDRAVFEAIQTELGIANPKYLTLGEAAMHGALREWAVPLFPWLNESESSTIEQQRRIYRWAKLKPLVPFVAVIGLALLTLVHLCISSFLPDHHLSEFRQALILLTIAAVIGFVLLAILFWKTLRHLEDTDLTQSEPVLNPELLARFAAQEDQIVQNHLAGMVLVKPGAVRSVIIHLALYVLRLYIPFRNYDGYLGSMRTIHFAHWALIGNAGRLLFLSNFDGSWQSYLDDFVDKAAVGLTLAWGNCVGFPPTKSLVLGGAAHGREFKEWARLSQTESLLWYSAYKDLTVNQILRNARVVDGLRKATLPSGEAIEWAAFL